MTYDIVVVGGSLGGCAAAMAASGGGFSVCLLEASAWLGGQYSAQGVTRPDDSQYTPSVGSTAGYRAFQQAVRTHYRSGFTLSPAGAAQKAFNPGGVDGGFATSPAVAHDVLLQQLQRPNVHVRLNARVTAAAVQGTSIASVTAVDGNGVQTVFEAKYFLDATDLGELLHLAGVEYALGAESRDETHEPNAPPVARPGWIQPITVVAALERRPDGEVHTDRRARELPGAQSTTALYGSKRLRQNGFSDARRSVGLPALYCRSEFQRSSASLRLEHAQHGKQRLSGRGDSHGRCR